MGDYYFRVKVKSAGGRIKGVTEGNAQKKTKKETATSDQASTG